MVRLHRSPSKENQFMTKEKINKRIVVIKPIWPMDLISGFSTATERILGSLSLIYLWVYESCVWEDPPKDDPRVTLYSIKQLNPTSKRSRKTLLKQNNISNN